MTNSSSSETGELLLLQARYVLQNLNAERPGCGYDKLADACERAALTRAQPQAGEAGQRLKGIANQLMGEAFCADWHDDPDVGVRETQRIHKLFVERINEFVCDEIRRARPTPTETVCAKCGAATGGEQAWVNGQIWCHPCADSETVCVRHAIYAKPSPPLPPERLPERSHD